MDDSWATVVALAGDRDLGATDTTIRAAQALAQLPRAEVADAMETLLRGHPCMAPLWRLASILVSERDHSAAVERFTADLEDHALAADARERHPRRRRAHHPAGTGRLGRCRRPIASLRREQGQDPRARRRGGT